MRDFFEKGLEEEVVDLSEDESEHWCEESVCVTASVASVLLISLVDLVCEVDLPSVSVTVKLLC